MTLDVLPAQAERMEADAQVPIVQDRQVTHQEYTKHYDRYRLRLQSAMEAVQKPHGEEIVDELLRIEEINKEAGKVHVYDTKHSDRIHEESELTFRVSPDAFPLPPQVLLKEYGPALVQYYRACERLIAELEDDHIWQKYLDHSKPTWMTERAKLDEKSHLFLRPDFILTEDAPVATEIETSPFGLGLSYFLDNAYKKAGQETSADEQAVLRAIQSAAGESICFVVTEYTDQYKGQFAYLCSELEQMGMRAVVTYPEELEIQGDHCTVGNQRYDSVYRCFYLHQASDDPKLQAISCFENTLPPCKPQLEEKALMGMLWDEEFESFFRSALTAEQLAILQTIIPKTWVVDADNVPDDLGIKDWGDLAELSRKQRKFILKTSGFSTDGSWAKGVVFLEKLNKQNCRETMKNAAHADGLYVLQEFRKGTKFSHKYFDFHASEMREMNGRVRVTPYYSVEDGSLLTAKATMCENTDIIHGMVDSINVPVVESQS